MISRAPNTQRPGVVIAPFVRIERERDAGVTPNDAWQSLGHAAQNVLAMARGEP